MDSDSHRWDEDEFLAQRREVLHTWPTGKELADPQALEEAIAFHREQPWWKSLALRCARAEEQGEVQFNGYVGHATVEATVEHLRYCEPCEPARWTVITDAYTRKNQYRQAQQAIDQSREKGYSLLSGYPVVCHGVQGARRLVEATRAALFCDCNDADGRLSWEIALAGGFTSGGAYPLNQTFTHERDVPLQKVIANFRYGDRLAVYYTKRGVPIMRISVAHLGGWSAMGMRLAVIVLQALMSAEQGVEYLQANLSIGASLLQDVAALKASKGLVEEYLRRLGYSGIKVYNCMNLWQGDWPLDREAIAAMIAHNVATGILAGVNSITLRSLDESRSTPTKEGFLASFKIARQVQRIIGGGRLPESEELKLEQRMLEQEARAIIDRTLALGEGDIGIGCVRAVESGVLDAMFMPYRPLKGKMLVVRDREGALRYLDHGDIPLPAEVLEYHREKLAEREKVEGTKAGSAWVIQEMTRMSSPLLREAEAVGMLVTGLSRPATLIRTQPQAGVVELAAPCSSVEGKTTEGEQRGQKKGTQRKRQPTVVLGTIGSDAHVVGASVLRHALREAGFQVTFLGALVSQEEFIGAALETGANAVLVSSLYGMARLDCEGFRDKCTEAGLKHVLLYIGGLLATDPEEWQRTRQIFLAMGMDRVYPPGTRPEEVIADLRKDLALPPKS